ncbi:MAG: hypothetical protein A3C93_01375 [Candidatus Lloydbacteria bacterium RIFCSPHIGHO2_02_FULL_54_17]|uniref:Small-conductance mechanosensitive ion channel n=1 Tax=Candidatus Lloydbacteria bacterium RIFCSPHIGHO2_02_FULL_54_17 TaxID=1798664 RepID=A0A1G2DBR3_9BACT|nr:MAG: hypothetical protein A2762_04640 [Candidatus Lloydbacteria bacterium RIFCSPHIGHO2_01_FULL_54_11]OGZ10983.1 MAG: hypothetical protein A3C93_01375 [Candidatus Lloydbacteria bacterium RIFCSPHIGHO2_02_FULL_54_17]OGZ13134.1 MAG: hypothetical protein A2948_02070 [Candidatus Lloydbacteria bacterium RIFCSPLOWO2_01_FULL_54_18]
MWQMLQNELAHSIYNVSGGVGALLPKLIVALLFVVVGWIFGVAVGRVIAQIVDALRVDTWLAKMGVDKFVERAGYHLNAGAFLGWLAKLFFIIVFLIVAFNVLGLSEVNGFLIQVLTYIPNVVVAMLVLFIASVAADILSGLVAGATQAVGSHVAHLLGGITRWSIWIFALMFAFSQLGIAPQFMNILFTGIVAMLALAGGLAFGLGGKEAAGDFIREVRTEIKTGRKQ